MLLGLIVSESRVIGFRFDSITGTISYSAVRKKHIHIYRFWKQLIEALFEERTRIHNIASGITKRTFHPAGVIIELQGWKNLRVGLNLEKKRGVHFWIARIRAAVAFLLASDLLEYFSINFWTRLW
jgi:hypothetical protein